MNEIEFYKTPTGKKFFEKHLPELIQSLNNLCNSINESNRIEHKKLLIEKKRIIEEKTE
jgi:hypothetical protein